MTHTGGCQCGAVRYRINGELSYPHLCHCRMCQKASGNYFMALGACDKDRLQYTRGQPSWFHSSNVVRRGFCSCCGTPLLFDPLDSTVVAVSLGSLDEPARVVPEIQSGQASRMPFYSILSSLPDEPETKSADWFDKVAAGTYQHPDHDTDEWPAGGAA